MVGFTLPVFVLDYTLKTIDSILSQSGLEGKEVEVDVYERSDVNKKHIASGQRIKGEDDLFKVTVNTDAGLHTDEWNYTILRESAGRSRKLKK
ncbi:hypothetical protein AAKU64_003305 [Undibacterium sp. GrIS 1.8]|uniref:hypothetical protein n=1 Tax=unclassified Undibacterium TaxID=2630295 RepID=UPI003394103E